VLTAKPDADSGFDGWSSNVCAEQGSALDYRGLVCSFTIADDMSVSADFARATLNLYLGSSGQGRVTSSPAGISCTEDCKATFPQGIQVKLTADPGSGSAVESWSNGVCAEQGSKLEYDGTTCTTTLDGDKSISISFKAGAAAPVPAPAAPTIGSSSPPPPPRAGKAVNVESEGGTTLVKLPGSSTYQRLKGGAQVPVGSVVDVTKGRMGLTSSGGASDFSKGRFVVREPKVAGARVTTLALTGGSFAVCPKQTKKAKRKTAGVAAAPRVVRQLLGSGKGRFRTSGRFASATVRGTVWTIQDRCDGTLVIVRKGTVGVTNLKTHKVVLVKAGKRYLAPR
jgi:hypothetical protein